MAEPSLHLDKDTQNDTPTVDWASHRNGVRARFPQPPSPRSESAASEASVASSVSNTGEPLPACIYPQGTKSLSGISLRAFLIGLVFGVSSSLTLVLACWHSIWRAPFFLASLSLFHFLEYFTTARYNTPYANISAFLLSRNGRAYNAAHGGAFLECVITSLLVPSWQARFSNQYTIPVALAVMALGQSIRSFAMAQAGTNFNHTVQTKRNEGHVLVKTGLYAWLRHPSYFGFFWWSLGTQLAMGNVVCFLAFAVILWGFFRSRTRKEEELLVTFFGQEYEDYRAQTSVWIPFIR